MALLSRLGTLDIAQDHKNMLNKTPGFERFRTRLGQVSFAPPIVLDLCSRLTLLSVDTTAQTASTVNLTPVLIVA